MDDDVMLTLMGLICRTPENGIERRTPSKIEYQNKYKSHTLPLRSGFDQLDRRGTTDKEGYLQAGPRLSPRKDNL